MTRPEPIPVLAQLPVAALQSVVEASPNMLPLIIGTISADPSIPPTMQRDTLMWLQEKAMAAAQPAAAGEEEGAGDGSMPPPPPPPAAVSAAE